eukprot:jgi/Chrzof1/13938/Cz08g18160.t1
MPTTVSDVDGKVSCYRSPKSEFSCAENGKGAIAFKCGSTGFTISTGKATAQTTGSSSSQSGGTSAYASSSSNSNGGGSYMSVMESSSGSSASAYSYASTESGR